MGTAAADGSSRSPAWVDAVELVGDVGNTVLFGARGDLTDRRARWAVTLVQVAGGVGVVLLRRRYPWTRSADLQLVATAMTDARYRGDLDVAELRRDPVFRAAQDRVNRRRAWLVAYGLGVIVAQRLIVAELRRRGVRRPHLVAGIVVATAQGIHRVGTLVTDSRHR